jgi:hypothetical protein
MKLRVADKVQKRAMRGRKYCANTLRRADARVHKKWALIDRNNRWFYEIMDELGPWGRYDLRMSILLRDLEEARGKS